MSARPYSARVRVRRQPERGAYDRASIDAVLDSGLVAQVAFVESDGQPVCVPMLYARVSDDLYIHGARSSRIMRRLAEGGPACVTITAIDGLVLARSAFEHSANYRSVMLLGRFAAIAEAERLAALEALTNKLVPGRWLEVRKPDANELKATSILALPISEASVKARSGPPSDDDSPDAHLNVWPASSRSSPATASRNGRRVCAERSRERQVSSTCLRPNRSRRIRCSHEPGGLTGNEQQRRRGARVRLSPRKLERRQSQARAAPGC